MWIGLDQIEGEDEWRLRRKSGKYEHTDDNDQVCKLRGVHTEANFTRMDQHVEKSVVDLFGENENEGNTSNIHFLGSLEKINVLFGKNSWAYAHEDVLKLPNPFLS